MYMWLLQRLNRLLTSSLLSWQNTPINVNDFLNVMMADPGPQCLLWLPILSRMPQVENGQYHFHVSVLLSFISSSPINQSQFTASVPLPYISATFMYLYHSHVSVPLQKCFILKYITFGFCWSLKLSCNRRITFIIFTCSISSGAMWGM